MFLLIAVRILRSVIGYPLHLSLPLIILIVDLVITNLKLIFGGELAMLWSRKKAPCIYHELYIVILWIAIVIRTIYLLFLG